MSEPALPPVRPGPRARSAGAALAAFALLALPWAAPAAAQDRGRPFSPPPDVEWIPDVEFARVGDRPLRLDILRPRRPPAEPMPALVYIHGGGFRGGDKQTGLRNNVRFARRGAFTVTIEYRLTGEARFPAAIEDCKAAVRWLRAHAEEYRVDPERIGVWGHSAGGHLAALLGTSGGVASLEGTGGNGKFSSRVTCVVDGFGPTDFPALVAARGGDPADSPAETAFIGLPFDRHLEAAKLASSTTHASADDPPFLIMHGTADPVVPFSQSELLAARLKAAGADVTFVPVQGAGHGWGTYPAAEARVDAFFDRHLFGKKDVQVSTEPVVLEGRPGGRGR